MPYEANDQRLITSLSQSSGQQLELTLQPKPDGWALRFLGFYNKGNMGIYQQAIDIAELTGQPLDIHADYLAMDGDGFLLGDGTLHYGPEQIAEVYYNIAAISHLTITPDLQFIRNPGYNRDRGPARFAGLRAHLEL